MTCTIRIIANAMGLPCPEAGHWLIAMDFEAHGGFGHLTVGSERTARRFVSKGAAMEYWRTVSRCRPVRPDGKPNRPLTAYTIEIVDEGD